MTFIVGGCCCRYRGDDWHPFLGEIHQFRPLRGRCPNYVTCFPHIADMSLYVTFLHVDQRTMHAPEEPGSGPFWDWQRQTSKDDLHMHAILALSYCATENYLATFYMKRLRLDSMSHFMASLNDDGLLMVEIFVFKSIPCPKRVFNTSPDGGSPWFPAMPRYRTRQVVSHFQCSTCTPIRFFGTKKSLSEHFRGSRTHPHVAKVSSTSLPLSKWAPDNCRWYSDLMKHIGIE